MNINSTFTIAYPLVCCQHHEYSINQLLRRNQHMNVAALSRLPLSGILVEAPLSGKFMLMEKRLQTTRISVIQTAQWTCCGTCLSQVLQHIRLIHMFDQYGPRSSTDGLTVVSARRNIPLHQPLQYTHGPGPPYLEQKIVHWLCCIRGKHVSSGMHAHLKWLEVVPMKTATVPWPQSNTYVHLRSLHDSAFLLFQTWPTVRGWKHLWGEWDSPHPGISLPFILEWLCRKRSTGFQAGICKTTSGKVHDCLTEICFTYRLTPHSTTGVSPAKLFLGCSLCSTSDCL